MSEDKKRETSPAIAAGIILAGVGLLFFLMPPIMLWLARYSTWLAGAFGIVSVLSFFLLFWLRGRYQRKHMPHDRLQD